MKVEPTDALIVVDVQRDFCPDGALPVEEGDLIVAPINHITPLFRHHFLTRDWHPVNHCSFSDDPQFVDGSWPVHCVAGTPGAQFHPDLIMPSDMVIVDKATDPAKEAYSDFDGLTEDGGSLLMELERRGVQRLFVCGLATDYCVRATALDGAAHGFEVVLLEDACRGIDSPRGSINEAIREMTRAGVQVRATGDLK